MLTSVPLAASVEVGSLPPFAAFAQQKKRADALSVRFLRTALSISRLQRRAAFRPMCQTGMSALGWELPLEAFHTNGSKGPEAASFTKGGNRPFATTAKQPFENGGSRHSINHQSRGVSAM
jgi:hypothetical protein